MTVSCDKLHVGCNDRRIPGWRNHDMDMDLRRPLPLDSDSISFILAEHVVEHLTPSEAWMFFREARRVLKPGGVIRVIVPCVELIRERFDTEYASFLCNYVGVEGSLDMAMESIICGWGHLSIWTIDGLNAVLTTLGFTATVCTPGESTIPELRGIDQHGFVIGAHANWVESGIVEARKRDALRCTDKSGL